jgi:hypothetical protein
MAQKKITNVQIETVRANQITDIVATENGGTGLASFTANKALYATSTSELTTGTLPTVAGGTGLSSFTANKALYATSSTALTTGTLPTAAGGTGLSSFIVNGAVYATSANTLSTGVLPVESGGTGASSGAAALNGFLPEQTGNKGKVLGTDGDGTLSWISPGGIGTVLSVDVSGGTTGLTTSGGPITSDGVITLAGKLSLANGGTGLTAIPGSSGQLIMNSSGSYAATSLMSYSGTSLTVGASDGTFTFAGAGPASTAASGSSIIIVGGQSGNTGVVGGEPGNVYVRGGPGGSGSGAAGGNVYLQGGSGAFRSGSVFVSTGLTSTERLRITPTGAWGLGGANYGTAGQVLTSNGNGGPPSWTTVSGGGGGSGGGSVTSVDVSGGETGLTTTGGPIVSGGIITIGGTLAITSGGTGATTALDAVNNLIGYTPVNKSGDTMTGPLTLSEAPTSDLHAATKQYVDSLTATGFSGGTVPNATTFSNAVTLSSSLSFGTAYTESTVNINSAQSTTIDCSQANNFIINMQSNITTLNFINTPTSGRLYYMALIIKQDATGSRLITWPISVKWPGEIEPVLTTKEDKYDVITLMTFNGGTTWLGFIAGQNY